MIIKGARLAGETVGLSKWLVEKFVLVSGKGMIVKQSLKKRNMCLVDEECEKLLHIYKANMNTGMSPVAAISKMRIDGDF